MPLKKLEGQFTKARQWGESKSQNRKGFGVFRVRGRFWRASGGLLEGFWHVAWGGSRPLRRGRRVRGPR